MLDLAICAAFIPKCMSMVSRSRLHSIVLVEGFRMHAGVLQRGKQDMMRLANGGCILRERNSGEN